jgi:hypothetical protein
MTLPDNSFFELMRSVFGNIKTPFNKQRLMADLTAFLSHDEIRKTIALYIDETDARVIAAIATLHKPAQEELEIFFAGELNYANLQNILLNLEERFILYRFREDGVTFLALNPALEPVLAPFAADLSAIFPSVSLEYASTVPADREPAQQGSPLDDRLLAAIISFIPGEGLFFKNEGGIRKKVLDSGELLFPALDLRLITGGLLTLGLFRQEGDGLVPNASRLAAFKDLSPRDRLEYCAAGIYCGAHESEGPAAGYLLRSRIKFLAALIDHFLNLIDPARAYPAQTLGRFWSLLEREAGGAKDGGIRDSGTGGMDGGMNSAGGVNGGAVPAATNRIRFDRLLDALEKAGLLLLSPAGYWTIGPGYTANSIAANDNGTTVAPVLAMDTAFSCIIYPGISFADALALGSFAIVRETGAAVRFEVTRESAVRGFDCGFTAAAMGDLLNRLSGNRVAELLIWTLKDWEKRYEEVSLCEGIVLSLSPDRRYLVEAEPLASLISRTITPGVYLLSASETREAVEALRKAGVDIFAQHKRPEYSANAAGLPDNRRGFNDSGEAGRHSSYPSPAALARYYHGLDTHVQFPSQSRDTARKVWMAPSIPPAPDPQGEGAAAASHDLSDSKKRESLKEQFRLALDKMQIPKTERDELSARIDRRLVLSESQLSCTSVRYEKLEARGLDYVGKASIAKQAITLKSLVEIKWPQAGGMQEIFGIPIALEKPGGESVLVIKPVSPAGQEDSSPMEPLRLPLGKISLIRRIKKSIFGE